MIRRGIRAAAGLLPVLAVIAPLALTQPAGAVVPITITPQLFTDGTTCATDATCSLRGAVLKANGDAAVTKIQLLAGTYTLSLSRNPQGIDDGSTGDLEILSSYTISGAGAGLTTVMGAPAVIGGGPGLDDRIFEVDAERVVQGPAAATPAVAVGPTIASITDMKVTGGNPANVDGGEADGGGILNDGQTLTINNVILDANKTNAGLDGNSGNGGGAGGGLANFGGAVTVSHSTFSNNTAEGDGGGIWNQDTGGLNDAYTNLFLTGNKANGVSPSLDAGGGAIYNEVLTGSSAVFADIMATNNQAANMNGGGVYENSRTSLPVTYDNMTLSGNTALRAGGGFYDGQGTPRITNSTITGNHVTVGARFADGGGVAIGVVLGMITLNNDTISNNTSPSAGGGLFVSRAETINLHNTLVINNTGSGGTVSNCLNQNGTIASTGHNIVNDATCALGGTADREGTQFNPNLDVLAANQGPTDGAPTATSPTLTQALPTGSIAINTADNTNCPVIDEQHVTRPQQAVCDVGAFEFVPAPPTPALPKAGAAGSRPDYSALVAAMALLVLTGIPVAMRARRSQ